MLASILWSGLVVAAVMALVVAVLMLFAPRVPIRYRIDRRMVPCPADGRLADVVFIVRGECDLPVDVLRCSHRPDEVPVMCGRECRSASVAPFAARQPALG